MFRLPNTTNSPLDLGENKTSNTTFNWPCELLLLGEDLNRQIANTAVKISKITAITINIVTAPLVVIFNGFVLFLVVKNVSLRKQRLVVLACLAFTDMFSGLLCQPFYIAKEVYFLKYTQPNCSLEKTFYLSWYTTIAASSAQLLIVTYERYIAITKPYKYPTRITNRRIICVTIAIWIEAILETALYYNYPFSTSELMYAKLAVASISVLGFAYICYCYLCIAVVVRKHYLQIKAQQRSVAVNTVLPNDQHIRFQRNSSMSAVILIAVLIITYFPLYICYGLLDLYGDQVRIPTFFSYVPLAETLVLLNSFLNPIIYCFRTKDFKHKLCRSLGLKTNELEPAVTNKAFQNQLPQVDEIRCRPNSRGRERNTNPIF